MPHPDEFGLMDVAAPRHTTLPDQLQRRRLLIVGDIHGCADEFRQLLDENARADDVVILVGDLVNKGPKSAEVVPIARSIGALAVVGNHELAVLRGRDMRRRGDPKADQRYEWTDAMSEEDIQYIRAMPYTISLPLHKAIVVHAGLVPGVELAEQTPRDMVSMRNVAKDQQKGGSFVAFEIDQPGACAWAPLWEGPQHIYFGHDAKRQLQLCSHATGLDTGCLYGHKLTAAVLELGKPPRLVSVPARRAYIDVSKKAPPSAAHATVARGTCSRGFRTAAALPAAAASPSAGLPRWAAACGVVAAVAVTSAVILQGWGSGSKRMHARY